VNLSIDTLDPAEYRSITGTGDLIHVLRSIDTATELIEADTKLDIVMYDRTVDQVEAFANYARSINSEGRRGRLALKFICIFPNNPAMFSARGEELTNGARRVTIADVLNRLSSLGTINPIERSRVVGDNPNCEYFLLDDDLLVGVLDMMSWGYRCGGEECRKLRVTPFGEAAACIQDELVSLRTGATDKIRRLMRQKEDNDIYSAERRHYRPQIGEVRFGRVSEPVPFSHFEEPCK
jgi:cyclic pyranopterin phosphate synthase